MPDGGQYCVADDQKPYLDTTVIIDDRRLQLYD